MIETAGLPGAQVADKKYAEAVEKAEKAGVSADALLKSNESESFLKKSTVLKVAEKALKDAGEYRKLDNLSALSKVVSGAKYEDVWTGTSLEYELLGDSLKESIIVKQILNEYIYHFTLNLENLVPVCRENGDIYLLDDQSNEVAFVIPAPFMVDANDQYSNAVEYTLAQNDDGYILTITADNTWINAEDRAFPVVIDPIINTSTSSTINFEYVTLESPYEDDGVVAQNDIYIGYEHRQYIPYIKINGIGSISAGSNILSANFSLYQTSCWPYDEYNHMTTKMYRTQSWNSSTISWSNPPVKDMSAYVVESCGDIYCANPTCTWEIEEFLQNACNSGESSLSVTLSTHEGNGVYYRGLSSPQLIIEYLPKLSTTGTESYRTTVGQSAGFAGSGAISHYTGMLTFGIGSLSTSDFLLPYTNSLIYNGEFAGQQTQTLAGITNYKSGYGFRQTYLEKLEPQLFGTECYYYYTDGDGTQHLFERVSGSGLTGTFTDVDGLKLTLTVSGSAGTSYTLIPKN